MARGLPIYKLSRVQLGGNGAFTTQALKMLDYFLATDLPL
jgi:hypothetical protein